MWQKPTSLTACLGMHAIGQNPTPKHNQYLTIKWNFSVVEPQEEVKAMRKSLHDHVNNSIDDFARCYQNLLQYPIKIDPQNTISSFESALIAIKQSPYRLYLLIDEYDNFANEVLMGRGEINPKRYNTLLKTEGSLKALFKTVK
jgi:hypothetical protein